MRNRYRNHSTGAVVTAERLVPHNIGSANSIASVRSSGTGYVVTTSTGEVMVGTGDWVLCDPAGKITVATHVEFAANHAPAPVDS